MIQKTIQFFVIFLNLCIFAHGQKQEISCQLYSNQNYYETITFLSKGVTQFQYDKEQNTRKDIAYRVLIINDKGYESLVIETIAMGEGDRNKQVTTIRKIDLTSLWASFSIEGTIKGITFEKWLSWNSFIIRIQNKEYEFKDIDRWVITVIKK